MRRRTGSNVGCAQLPGFADSLRLLVERERYSLTDIGLMFGVSHQRIDQLCVRLGIQHPDKLASRGMYAIRVWDDSANCFRPEQRGEVLDRQRRVEGDRYRAKRLTRRVERRAVIVAQIAELRRALGRDPTGRKCSADSTDTPIARTPP